MWNVVDSSIPKTIQWNNWMPALNIQLEIKYRLGAKIQMRQIGGRGETKMCHIFQYVIWPERSHVPYSGNAFKGNISRSIVFFSTVDLLFYLIFHSSGSRAPELAGKYVCQRWKLCKSCNACTRHRFHLFRSATISISIVEQMKSALIASAHIWLFSCGNGTHVSISRGLWKVLSG